MTHDDDVDNDDDEDDDDDEDNDDDENSADESDVVDDEVNDQARVTAEHKVTRHCWTGLVMGPGLDPLPL